VTEEQQRAWNDFCEMTAERQAARLAERRGWEVHLGPLGRWIAAPSERVAELITVRLLRRWTERDPQPTAVAHWQIDDDLARMLRREHGS
jgi:hypothetical protein